METGVWACFSLLPSCSHSAAETDSEGQPSARGWSLRKTSEEVKLRAFLLFGLRQMEKVEESGEKTPNPSMAGPSVSVYFNKVKGKPATKAQHTFAPDFSAHQRHEISRTSPELWLPKSLSQTTQHDAVTSSRRSLQTYEVLQLPVPSGFVRDSSSFYHLPPF